MRNALRLAELLANRLCHDLASPLGGMLAALDMIGREPEAVPDARDAGQALRRRFVLLRAAWGAAPEAMDGEEFRALALGLPSGRRVAVTVGLAPVGARFGQIGGQLALNALLLASESLPRGGGVTVSGNPAGRLSVAIAGRDARWPAALPALLGDPALAWNSLPAPDDVAAGRALQAPLTAILIHAAGAHAALVAPDNGTLATLLLDLSNAG